MFLLNLRHDDATQRPKRSRTSPGLAKSIWCYWSRNISIGWRQREAFLRDQTKINFAPKIKTTYPRSQITLSCLCSQTTKAFLFWMEQLKTKKINHWKLKLAHCEETGSDLKQDSPLPRKTFHSSNFADDAFQKEKAFPRQKVVSSTNLPQMVRCKNNDVCGKDVLKKKTFRFQSFFSFKNCAFFLKFSKPSNFPNSDVLVIYFRIQMENNLRKHFSIGNPQQICHPTLSEEKHLNLPQPQFSHVFETSYYFSRLSHNRPVIY